MTECKQSGFGLKACGKREIVARFDGGTISSDGGAMLVRQTDRRLNLLPRRAGCFLDGRNQKQVEHPVLEMRWQRICGLTLGYEDINDHEQLRNDPVFSILAGRAELERPRAGKSRLNRLELSGDEADRYKKIKFLPEAVDELLVKTFLASHPQAPERIILDAGTLDAGTTGLPLHGRQEGRFFHGYDDCCCYLPLYIFCGGPVLCARWREANHDAAFDSREEIERTVKPIRKAWPAVKIIVRGDSGFCRNELMSWCESHGVATRPRRRRKAAGTAFGAWRRKRSLSREKKIRASL